MVPATTYCKSHGVQFGAFRGLGRRPDVLLCTYACVHAFIVEPECRFGLMATGIGGWNSLHADGTSDANSE